ncbi:lipopolysaccharide biosynthesis protein [Echinicola sp. 20G]|uniref:lipopolysaccharide biosynthesis protein n=1 Tax=Echinicola sp. 20G TaxID=2781961 RepID=UPI0019101699|nr:hypothetical protein [Echinicola sp. 20G]
MNQQNRYYSFFINKLGVNQEILWSGYNQLWAILKGPISIFFIIKYLLPNQQGLWFTFINLGALKIFAELGFTMIITQFVSHEFANINDFDKKLGTNDSGLSKLVSLIRFSLKFYLKIVPIAILIMIVVGYFYFRNESKDVFFAWIFSSIVGGSSLLISVFQGIYKGIGKVKEVQKNLFLGSIAMGVGNWVLLIFKFNIWALVFGNLAGILIMGINLYARDTKFWSTVLNYNLTKKYNWFSEIIGLQWRYAISWASGYFIFNLIVPVLYKFESAEVAGKYGLSMRVISAFIGISQAWITTKIPQFNFLVAQDKFRELNSFFKKSLIQSFMIQILFSLFIVLGLYVLSFWSEIGYRFLSLKYIVVLLLIQIPMQIVNCFAIYLRAFKKEPFVIYSLVNAFSMLIASFLILPEFGFNGMLIFLLLVYWLGLLPYATFIFTSKKAEFVNLNIRG